jgi:hypothetical protein
MQHCEGITIYLSEKVEALKKPTYAMHSKIGFQKLVDYTMQKVTHAINAVEARGTDTDRAVHPRRCWERFFGARKNVLGKIGQRSSI